MNFIDKYFRTTKINRIARDLACYSSKKGPWYERIYSDEKIKVVTEYSSQDMIKIFIRDRDKRSWVRVYYTYFGLVQFNKGLWVNYLFEKDKAVKTEKNIKMTKKKKANFCSIDDSYLFGNN